MIISKIQAIELGWGPESIFFSTDVPKTSHQYVDDIEVQERVIDGRIELVYCGFRNNKPVFQMSAGSNITIYYQR